MMRDADERSGGTDLLAARKRQHDTDPSSSTVGTTPPAGLTALAPIRSACRPVNVRALSPYHRALLTIDGTVTKFIEAFTMELVNVFVLAQRTVPYDGDQWLDVAPGTSVLARHVLLQGAREGQLHAYAASLLVIERLPMTVRQGLERNPGGIGKALLASRIETRREVLWYGMERAETLPEEVRARTDSTSFLTRTYLIISSGRPMMLITEKFPIGIDELPAHH
jgi:chorismate-pyruvate lyase